MRRKLLTLLFLLVFVSGCVGTSSNTETQGRDFLKINYIDVYPSTTIHPGQPLTIRMEVENVGQGAVDIYVGEDGKMILYSLCEPLYSISEDGFKVYGSKNENDINDDGMLTIEPDEFVIFEWRIETPTEKDISDMIHKCEFKFKVAYSATTKTTTYIYFDTPEDINQRVYTKKDLSLAGNNVATKGPVYIDVESPNQPYPTDAPFVLFTTMYNIGNGIAEIKSLTITYEPKYLDVSSEEDCPMFETGSGKIKLDVAKAKDLIKIYNSRSSTFTCKFNIKNINELTPVKFEFTSYYYYYYLDDVEITVKPYKMG